MTPSTRLATLVLAISWLPYALAAEARADPTDPDHQLRATLERKIEAEFGRKIEAEPEREFEVPAAELLARERFRSADSARRAGGPPAAPAPQMVADSARTTSSGASGRSLPRAAEEPAAHTVCSFSPPRTFRCVLRTGRRQLILTPP